MINLDNAIARATTIQSSAVLFDLSISVYSANKTDRNVTEEVAGNKNASSAAGNYMKKLFADNKALADITKYAAGCRNWNNKNSLPWSDNGLRLVSMGILLDHQAQIKNMEKEFWVLVKNFLDPYETNITAASFPLGSMFNRDEYPSRDEVTEKFKFRYVYLQIPDAGDFRVDTMNAGLREIADHTEQVLNDRITLAMREAWDRLHNSLVHLRDKMTDDERKKRIHVTLLPNIHETINILQGLNITGDADLDNAAKEVLALVNRLDLKDLKNDPDARKNTKQQVDAILNKFNW